MPIFQQENLKMFDRAKAYAKENKLNYFAAYHLLRWAKLQDGDPIGREHPDMPVFLDMDSEVQAAVNTATTALLA